MTETQKLLVEYVQSGSEAAFRELVERYVGLVYSTAFRLVGADTAMAEDVAQTVFVDLARLSESLSNEVRLGGWLHRHTCFVAAKTMRGERRRQSREKQAVEMNTLTDHSAARLTEVAPILDEAINELGATDRAAVLLRFYERLDFRSVAQALGTNEFAAQKRVTRALEKLHTLLKRRGVALSAVALGVALAGEAVKAAPAELASSIAGPAIAGAAAGTGHTISLFKAISAFKLKAGTVTAILVASVAAPWLTQHYTQARLRELSETDRRQSDQIIQLTADNRRLAGFLIQSGNFQPIYGGQFHELMRIRSKVGLLKDTVQKMKVDKISALSSPRDQLASLTQMWALRVDRLKQWLEKNPSEKIPEFQNIPEKNWLTAVRNLDEDGNLERAASNLRVNAQMLVLNELSAAGRKYVSDNNGQFPTDLSALVPYLKSPVDNAILQRYEIVPASSLVPELQPGSQYVITQMAAVNKALDPRMAYDLSESRFAGEEVSNRWTWAP